MYMSKNYKQHGFTLIEIAIVLLVVTILLGYTVAMFPVQQELKQYREANREMNSIINNLIAFAQVNGRLPCPDTSGGGGSIDGLEDSLDVYDISIAGAGNDNIIDGCAAYFGYLPAKTLGMIGNYKSSGPLKGTLLDPWGGSYGYAVSESDVSGNTIVDFVSPNEIRNEGIQNVMNPAALEPPDLFICDDSATTGPDLNCTAASSNPVVSNVAAVVISLGKDNNITDLTTVSPIQVENVDDINDGTNDKVYISSSRSNVDGKEYDDIVKWISPNLLFSKMIEADQLP
jgi:prepilin-type N-terminal cleavage/methylation domain-containing protein